ncbi:hypothetical protein RDI86_02030 [Cellulosimicrobium sp. XJ-DQ-B-000]|uniref:hypothetical protein n=1 Tax=Cellulosimicrobium sp. XJ-DQ-B-000 TaxID=3072182 RepID=UPI0028067FB7|nr:hypothetical protein [Cellulosimicrobium sp. XJ-DQ-B-000]MDQ8040626.1 hypothetical protein [Cellulosimicrobium sp. XJ-DQ-B-000]
MRLWKRRESRAESVYREWFELTNQQKVAILEAAPDLYGALARFAATAHLAGIQATCEKRWDS